jgi:hypothetical protein
MLVDGPGEHLLADAGFAEDGGVGLGCLAGGPAEDGSGER